MKIVDFFPNYNSIGYVLTFNRTALCLKYTLYCVVFLLWEALEFCTSCLPCNVADYFWISKLKFFLFLSSAPAPPLEKKKKRDFCNSYFIWYMLVDFSNTLTLHCLHFYSLPLLLLELTTFTIPRNGTQVRYVCIQAVSYVIVKNYLVATFLHYVFPFQGSLNKFHGQHALRERARKIDQGILIIR